MPINANKPENETANRRIDEKRKDEKSVAEINCHKRPKTTMLRVSLTMQRFSSLWVPHTWHDNRFKITREFPSASEKVAVKAGKSGYERRASAASIS